MKGGLAGQSSATAAALRAATIRRTPCGQRLSQRCSPRVRSGPPTHPTATPTGRIFQVSPGTWSSQSGIAAISGYVVASKAVLDSFRRVSRKLQAPYSPELLLPTAGSGAEDRVWSSKVDHQTTAIPSTRSRGPDIEGPVRQRRRLDTSAADAAPRGGRRSDCPHFQDATRSLRLHPDRGCACPHA